MSGAGSGRAHGEDGSKRKFHVFNPYFVKLKHTRGGISVFSHIDGFHEFVMRVKTASTKVTVKGL